MINCLSDWLRLSKKLRENIMASRIQNTWREYVKDKAYYFERLESRYNRLANHDFTDESYCKKISKPKKKIHKKVRFSKTNITLRKNLKKQEDMIHLDGTKKPTTIYLKAVLLWKCHLGPNDNFFDGICKKYVDTGSSINWNTWTNNIIYHLKKEGNIRLWSSLGEIKNFYMKDIWLFDNFQKYWNSYCNQEIDDKLSPFAAEFIPSSNKSDDYYLICCK